MSNAIKKMSLIMKTGLDGSFGNDNRTAYTELQSNFSTDVSDSISPQFDENSGTLVNKVLFNAGQTIIIKRARLMSKKAAGLQTATIAGTLLLGAGKPAPNGSMTTDPITLMFKEWNEWEEKDANLEIKDDGSTLWFGEGSQIRYDDFNTQDVFSDQSFDAYLEIEGELKI